MDAPALFPRSMQTSTWWHKSFAIIGPAKIILEYVVPTSDMHVLKVTGKPMHILKVTGKPMHVLKVTGKPMHVLKVTEETMHVLKVFEQLFCKNIFKILLRSIYPSLFHT